MTDFTDATLSMMSDPSRISKIYRVDTSQRGEESVSREAESFVMGTMALKGS